MMKNATRRSPNLKKDVGLLFSVKNEIRDLRRVVAPEPPIGDKSKDILKLYTHFLNVIHLRLRTQISLLVEALNLRNPEIFSVARGCMETVAAMVYISDKFKKRYESGEFSGAWNVLHKATMGGRSFPLGEGEIRAEEWHPPESYNVLTYIQGANKLITSRMKDVLKEENEVGDEFEKQYNTLSEFTHPNYLGLQLFWDAKNGQFEYEKIPSCLREENLSLLLHHVMPALTLYCLFLKDAQKFEEDIS